LSRVETAATISCEAQTMKIEDVLVPIDFSATSLNAIRFAKSLMDGTGEIHLMHVVDAEFIEKAVEQGLGERDAVHQTLYRSAEQRLETLAKEHESGDLTIKAVVVVGRPFVEIVRLAQDLDFQIIVMGTHGQQVESIEHALFGTTAERVLRTTNLPVMCVPHTAPKKEDISSSAAA
jgi:nucleotide-binding universal stress UspA family protein